MSIQEVTCLTLTCDQCGKKAEGFEDVYVHHFENREDLNRYVADAEWAVDEEGRASCWSCRGKEEPEAFDR